MARKPESPPAEPSDRDRIVEAFMALLAEQSFGEIDFTVLASRSGVPLHRCRAAFNSPLGVLAAHMEAIDRAVLAADDADMAEEPVRERLFDILMRRLEALGPHKAAIRSLARSARGNPPLALALNCMAMRSQAWMLNAAGISTGGIKGALRAQGMACLYADVLRAWMNDDDPGLARTMATLDRALARGQRWSGVLDGVSRLSSCVGSGRSRRHRAAERDDREDIIAA